MSPVDVVHFCENENTEQERESSSPPVLIGVDMMRLDSPMLSVMLARCHLMHKHIQKSLCECVSFELFSWFICQAELQIYSVSSRDYGESLLFY